jgi:hypothetical protein
MLLLIGQCLILFLNSLSQNYTKHVGRKSTFRILNRGSAKALDKVVELDGIVYFHGEIRDFRSPPSGATRSFIVKDPRATNQTTKYLLHHILCSKI